MEDKKTPEEILDKAVESLKRQTLESGQLDEIAGRVRKGQFLGDAERVAEGIIQPDAGGRASKKMEIVGKNLPDFAVILLDRPAIDARYAQIFEGDSL